MMHCTMDDLIALRDGEGSQEAQRHVAKCAACQAEFESLHQRGAALKALPALRPPRERWSAVRAEIEGARRRRRRAVFAWGSLVAAAAAVGVIGVQAARLRSAADASAADLRALVEQSQRLEEALRAYDPTSRVLNGRAASAVAEIEDRIAVIDLGLAEAQSGGASRAELLELWRQRVQLMDELVRVHVTRAAYVGL